MMAEYRIDFSIQRRHDGEDDFTEVGFGSSGAWDGLDFCTHMVAAAVSHGEWETTPGMPSPEDVIAALDGGGGVMAEQTAAEQAHPFGDPDARYEVGAMFQDGEVFTIDRMALGMGLFDDEAPALVARRVGDDEWLTLGSGGGFVAEYTVWDDEEEPS